MAEYAGSALYIIFGATRLDQDYRTLTTHEEAGIVDASAGADTYRSKVATLTDANAKVELVAQAGGTALWAALAPGTSGTLEVGPEGTATGKIRQYGIALVKTRERGMKFDDLVTIMVDFEWNSTVTNTVY